MRVAISGSTGMIGEALIADLRGDGHTINRLVRDRSKATGDDVYWSVERHELDADRLEGVDAVVHLAARPIGANRWTADEKQQILESRARGTRLLSEGLASLSAPPRVLVSMSGADYYGDRGDELLTEDSPAGNTFLAEVCAAWEEGADPARAAGIRVVHPRNGVVIAETGPLMDKVRLPFTLGVGGRIGDGRQYVPWIAMEDEIRALRFLLDRDDLEGPVNLVSPQTATNRELTKAIGAAMHRPTVMPIPAVALKILYGELGIALGVHSKRVVPAKLRDAGFEWRHPDLTEAMRIALS